MVLDRYQYNSYFMSDNFMSILPAKHNIHTHVCLLPGRPEEGVYSLELELWKIVSTVWELNPGPLQKQQALLTAELHLPTPPRGFLNLRKLESHTAKFKSQI